VSISKSRIPYLMDVWNVVVGCYGPHGTAERPRRCKGCWAERFYATRGQGLKCELCRKFIPHVHPERLAIPGGKPKVIGAHFMCDMGGLPDSLEAAPGRRYTDVPDAAIFDLVSVGVQETMRNIIATHPEHIFVSVTKRPEGLPDLDGSTGLTTGWPENWYVGATCTTQAEVDERVPALLRSGVVHPFLNLEPLCEGVLLRPTLRPEFACPACGWSGNATGNNVCPQCHTPEPSDCHSRGYKCSDCGHDMEDDYEWTCPQCGRPTTDGGVDVCSGLMAHEQECIRRVEGVILGGMSKQGRDQEPVPLHPDSVRAVRDQCADAGVPFYFKQWGYWMPQTPGGFVVHGTYRESHPPLLDGRTHRALPGRWGEIINASAE